jgi:hypothetical protein
MGGRPKASLGRPMPATCGRATLPLSPCEPVAPMVVEPMRRRVFISLLGRAAAAWPLTARAQQPGNVYRIAIVRPSGSAADMTDAIENPSYFALFKELRRLGYVERQNLVVHRYSAEGRQERFPRSSSFASSLLPAV